MKITGASWIFLDTETTGLKPEEGAQIIELGWCAVRNMTIEGSVDHLIDPGRPIPPEITRLTGISDKDVQGQPSFSQVAPKFLDEYQRADFIAAYNKDFDRKMLQAELKRAQMDLPEKIWLDPLTWARKFAGSADNRLAAIARQFKVSLENAHRADADAQAAAKIMIEFFNWGVEEANFPDDVEALKGQERSWRSQYQAASRIMKPLKDPQTGKIALTGEPGKMAPDVYDHYARAVGEDHLRRVMQEKWGRRK